MENVRDYLIMIASYKRSSFLKTHTYATLKKLKTNAKILIICSDDDDTIDDYKKIFGDENIFVFNKDYYENKLHIDVGDSFYRANNIKKGILWARNVQFEVARKFGYRYFLFLDDDYDSFSLRRKFINPKDNKAIYSSGQRIIPGKFDEVCEHYFRILDSQPFMYCTAFCQRGDMIGGLENILYKKGYKFKAMNAFFCDIEKEFRYMGRINEDVNAYTTYNNKGQLFLTLSDVCLNQPTTQMTSGGMSDIYKQFGTWLKSIYSVMYSPNAVKINTMGNKRETFRIHHNIEFDYCVPKILNQIYCKDNPLDYKNDVMKDTIILDKEGNVIDKRKYNFLSEECKFINDEDLILYDKSLNDMF